MSKINQIEKSLQEIDATKFHKLTDVYLAKAYSYKITSNGTKLAEDKPTKGTPDSFAQLENGKYIFIEYTTQKTKIKDKFLDDIEKCFDENKTGIKVTEIEKIILACNSDLNTKEIKALQNKCLDNSIECTIFGNSTIAHELFNNYPSIAKEFLSISIDSGQILDYDDFIKNYDSNKYSTSINTSLQCREDEFKELYSLIDTSNIVLVTGVAGIGKTKLSIEVCSAYAKEHNYQFKAILNRNVNIFDDIKSYFNEESKKYLVFIDDVNRIHSALEYIQEYYGAKLQNDEIKIIATVRDYAKEKIFELVPIKLSSNEFELKALSDEAINTIVKNEYNITNHLYLERITDISKGNPRLALMAASIAKEKNTLESIYDVTALYDEYFSAIKKDLEVFNDENFLKAITIVAFFRTVDKENSHQVELIENIFNISIDNLWVYINKLNDLEIFDLHENKVVKVSDQILSTYLFYKIVFVDKKIELYLFLEYLFPQYKTRLIDILNPLINTFDTQYIISVLKEPVNKIWNKYTNDESTLYDVMGAFWFLKQTDILAYFADKIDKLDREEININSLDFWNKPNNNRLDNPILEKLSVFKHDSLHSIKMAIELILIYFEKRPSELQKVIYVLINNYGFEHGSYQYSYDKESLLINTLWTYCDNGNNELISKLFIQVSSSLLKTEFENNKSKGNQISFQRFKLPETEELKSLRDNIFKLLNTLYSKSNYQKDIIKLIQEYPRGISFQQKVSDVEKWDSKNIINFIQENFNTSSYEHTKTVHECLDSFDRVQIEYDSNIRTKFEHPTYEIETKLLIDDVAISLEKPRNKDNNTDWDKIREIKYARLSTLVESYDLAGWELLFEQCKEFYNSKTDNTEHYKFENNLRELFHILEETNQELYIQVIEKYIQLENPFNIDLNLVNLISILGKEEAFKLINKYTYNRKDSWIFNFFMSLSEEVIDIDDINTILELYKTSDIHSMTYSLDYLIKYLGVEVNIFILVTEILTQRAVNENKKFIYGINMLFNSHAKTFQNLEKYFENNIELLKESYLVCINSTNHFDHDCKALDKLINLDNTFLEKFIYKLFEGKSYLSSHDIHGDFSIIWSRNNYETIFFNLIELLYSISKEKRIWREGEILKSFFRYQQGREDIRKKVDNVIKKYIETYNNNKEKMAFLFEFICESNQERRKEFISYFLKKNNSFGIFEELSLEPSHRGWSGSLVPHLQQDKDYYSSLLELVSGIKFLKHKQKVEKQISYIEKHIESEKKKDFMSDY